MLCMIFDSVFYFHSDQRSLDQQNRNRFQNMHLLLLSTMTELFRDGFTPPKSAVATMHNVQCIRSLSEDFGGR